MPSGERYREVMGAKQGRLSDMDGPRDCHTEWSLSKTNAWYQLYVQCKKKKKGTNELIYKTEMEYTLMVTKRKEGVNWETGIDIHILLLLLTHFSCVWLCGPMDCSPSGSSCPWNFLGKNTGVGCHAHNQGIFPTQGSNPGLLYCRHILYCWAVREAPSTHCAALCLVA